MDSLPHRPSDPARPVLPRSPQQPALTGHSRLGRRRSGLLVATGLGVFLFVALASGVRAAAAPNDNLGQVQATEVNLLRALVEQGVLTADKAAELLRRAGIDPDLLKAPIVASPRMPQAAPVAPAPPAVAPAAGPARLMPEATHDELLESVRQEVQAQSRAEGRANAATVPSWVQRISFGGDVRLRYLRNDYASDNGASSVAATGTPPPPPNPLNAASAIDGWYQLPAGTTNVVFDAHEYLQMRVRLNLESQVNEQLHAGVRLVTATGNDATASPVSYDVELGRFGRPFSAGFSLAYLQWTPLAALTVTAGRMMNPYFKSDLIFSPDLSLDGFAAGYAPHWGQGWGAFLNAGAHPLQTNQSGPFNTASNQWLYAAQSGVSWTAADETRARLALAYYDFSGIQGKADPALPANNGLNDDSAPLFRQFGNTMFNLRYQVINNLATPIAPLYGYAAQFRLMNLGADLELARFDPMRIGLQFDWVRNVGFNAAEIRQRLGPAIGTLPYLNGPSGTAITNIDRARIDGYLVNLRLGATELRHYGDWQLFSGVRYLQRDAVPDAFTSVDYRLGGTDNQATFLGVNVGLSAATSVTLRYIAARSIDAGPKFGVDSWFLDLNGRF